VQEAAVIGVVHEKWGERPLLVVVRKAGTNVTKEALLDFLKDKIATWCAATLSPPTHTLLL
jgi:acyl-CoA synthetase (AMP-forming)/AMP-acid ligase II